MSNCSGQSTPFVMFMLSIIEKALEKFAIAPSVATAVTPQVKEMVEQMGNNSLMSSELLSLLGLADKKSFRKSQRSMRESQDNVNTRFT